MIRIAIASLALSALVLAGCEGNGEEATTQASTVSMGIINEDCPMMGGSVDPTAETAEWNGSQVGFCCGRCINAWNGLSDEEKASRLAEVGVE